jgi:hypothetical protein
MVGENFLLDLHKMQDNIGNRCRNFQHQNNVLRVFSKIFCNDPKLFGIHPLLQTEVIND